MLVLCVACGLVPTTRTFRCEHNLLEDKLVISHGNGTKILFGNKFECDLKPEVVRIGNVT